METNPAIQDTYPSDVAHCYGCGSLNEMGHQIKTRIEGDGTATEFEPAPFHTAIPGFVYGGLIASVIDCHSTGSAAIFAMQERGMEIGDGNSLRFVTAHLEVDYLAPTPLALLRVTGEKIESSGRKVVVKSEMIVNGQLTARGHAVLIEIPEGLTFG